MLVSKNSTQVTKGTTKIKFHIFDPTPYAMRFFPFHFFFVTWSLDGHLPLLAPLQDHLAIDHPHPSPHSQSNSYHLPNNNSTSMPMLPPTDASISSHQLYLQKNWKTTLNQDHTLFTKTLLVAKFTFTLWVARGCLSLGKCWFQKLCVGADHIRGIRTRLRSLAHFTKHLVGRGHLCGHFHIPFTIIP